MFGEWSGIDYVLSTKYCLIHTSELIFTRFELILRAILKTLHRSSPHSGAISPNTSALYNSYMRAAKLPRAQSNRPKSACNMESSYLI